MKTMAATARSIVGVAAVFALLASAACVDDKCAACSAVAAELEVELLNEKTKNHLDMRHRLNSKGQREGKVIDYRVSELRAVELLDDLCEKMLDYMLEEFVSSELEWVKVDSWNGLEADKKRVAKAHAKDISNYCGSFLNLNYVVKNPDLSASNSSFYLDDRLLEDTEDELTELIKKGSVKPGGVKKVLCEDLSRHCSPSSLDDEL